MLHRLVRLHSCMGDQGETYGETELGYRVEPNSLKGQRFLRPLFFSFFFFVQGVHIGDTNGQRGEWREVAESTVGILASVEVSKLGFRLQYWEVTG